jgi:hypothetical protein
VFAAAKALKGSNSDVVLEVVQNIQKQQKLIFKAGMVVVTSLWVHCIAMIWSKTSRPVAIFCTFLFVLCYAFMVAVTRHFYDLFHPYQLMGKDVAHGAEGWF